MRRAREERARIGPERAGRAEAVSAAAVMAAAPWRGGLYGLSTILSARGGSKQSIRRGGIHRGLMWCVTSGLGSRRPAGNQIEHLVGTCPSRGGTRRHAERLDPETGPWHLAAPSYTPIACTRAALAPSGRIASSSARGSPTASMQASTPDPSSRILTAARGCPRSVARPARRRERPARRSGTGVDCPRRAGADGERR